MTFRSALAVSSTGHMAPREHGRLAGKQKVSARALLKDLRDALSNEPTALPKLEASKLRPMGAQHNPLRDCGVVGFVVEALNSHEAVVATKEITTVIGHCCLRGLNDGLRHLANSNQSDFDRRSPVSVLCLIPLVMLIATDV
jgi:hypothetical protein